MAIPDIATLTYLSSLVVVGRVASAAVSTQAPQSVQTPIGQSRPTSPQSPSGITVPITTYQVDVERTLRGTPPAQLTVTQIGNPIRNAIPSPDDAPLVQAERYVLFLQPSGSGDGSYAAVGDIQGRLALDAQDRLHVIGSGSPATRPFDGQPLSTLIAALP
jgi:hypothetical protein